MPYSASLLLINVFLWIIMFIICKPRYVLLLPRRAKALQRALRKRTGAVVQGNPEQAVHTGNMPQAPRAGVRRISITHQPPTRMRVHIFFLLLFAFSVFAFSEHDTYHTWFDFIFTHDYNYYEPIYQWLAYATGERYFLWRAIIWGVAVFLLFHLGKRLRCITWEFMLVCLLILPTSYFVATRGSAGHMLLLWSMIWILPTKSKHKKWKILLGIIGVYASFFLHRSIILNIFLALFALLPLKLNRKTVILATIIAFPFLVSIVTTIIIRFTEGTFQLNFGDNMALQERAMRFASDEDEEKANLNGIISYIALRLPYYLMLAYCAYKIAIKKLHLGSAYKYMYKLTYCCFYIGALFAFQKTSFWLYQRITFMGLFPLVFIFPRVLNAGGKRGRLSIIILCMALFAVAWTFAYRYYKWS